jgi:glutamate racemase
VIGVFDSGIGGLTVVRRIFELLPDRRVVYFGDTARLPYGTKSPETVTAYAIQDAQFLLERGARLIVVACNSASAVALDALAARFDVPILGVIEPAVEAAARVSKAGEIGVIGTRATVTSGIYQRLMARLRPEAHVRAHATPLLVSLVEEDWMAQPETASIVRRYLEPLCGDGIDTLILACTHYPLLAGVIAAAAGPAVTLVDPSLETVLALKALLDRDPALAASLERGGGGQFYVSDITPHFRTISSQFLGRDVGELRKVSLE